MELPVEDYYFASAVHDREAVEFGRGGGGDNHVRDMALGGVVTLVVAGLALLAASPAGRAGRSQPEPKAVTVK